MLTHGILPDVHGGVHIFLPPHTIGSVQSLSGHAVAYRCRSLPRVRWHRASIVLKVVRVMGAAFASPWTNYYCAPLFSHTHYWYEVSMFKYRILVQLLLYSFMDTFSPSDLFLYSIIRSQMYTVQNHPLFVKTSSRLHYCCTVDLFLPGRISSVVFQNIISTAAVLDILEFRVSSKLFRE